MDAIKEKARQLGEKLAGSEEYNSYRRLSEVVNNDPSKKEVLDSYITVLGKIKGAEDVEDISADLREEYEKQARLLNGDPDLTAFLHAQEIYLELVNGCMAIITDFE